MTINEVLNSSLQNIAPASFGIQSQPEEENFKFTVAVTTLAGLLTASAIALCFFRKRSLPSISSLPGRFFGSIEQNILRACREGNYNDVMKYLRLNKANANFKGSEFSFLRERAESTQQTTPLIAACQYFNPNNPDSMKIVEYVMKLTPNINEKDATGFTALHHATKNGHALLTQKLLERPDTDIDILVDSNNTGNHTPFSLVVLGGHFDTAKVLLDHMAEKEKPIETAFIVACQYFDPTNADSMKIVEYAMKLTKDVNKKDSTGYSPLHRAAKNGHTQLIAKLLERSDIKIDILAQRIFDDIDSYTPLALAVLGGHVDAAKELLRHEATMEQEKGIKKDSLLHIAVETIFLEKGKDDLIEALIQAGLSVNIQNSAGETPLHHVAGKGLPSTARKLLELKADVNALTTKKQTPLHFAALNAESDIVQLFLENGITDKDAKDFEGKTPLHYAAEKGLFSTAKKLLEHKADVKALNKKNQTPLHLAALNGKNNTIQLLLENGANKNAKDLLGKTAFDLAENEEIKNSIKPDYTNSEN